MKPVLPLCLLAALLFAGELRADVAAGKSTYAARGCIGCHGAGGVSTLATNPSLKGRDADYVKKALTEYRNGARENAVMNAMAAGLSDAEIHNLSRYIQSLK